MEINENKEVTETDNEELFVDAVNDAPPPQDAMTTTTAVVEEEGGYDDDVGSKDGGNENEADNT